MPTPEKTIEILTQEIESLSSVEMHDLVLFYYRINHQHFNITSYDKFNEFLESFDKNPFRINDDKNFKKQLAENLVAFTNDYMSLITAVELISCESLFLLWRRGIESRIRKQSGGLFSRRGDDQTTVFT